MTERKCSAKRTAKEAVKHKTRRLTVSSARNYPEYVPFAALRIKGKWLEAAGFPVGTPVEIVVEDGRMVVTAQPKPEKRIEKEMVSALAVRKTRELKKFMARIEKKRG
ncbi:TPA: SymE family type I addiction module toxin [Enterobacter chuandaensis]|uniref:SymE family type I addiction module toxin n=1 Tax=Enterobacter TaxID=547 RepID=UPI00124A1BB6|nr:SymE family type I addiction module toxin [Enterobacter sp. 168J2]MCP1112884.1 SymE family type I addiction module toxin [Enterobacter bugandensis]HBU6130977.1 SymE family type I addiction module toxin [Enterobacter cloacae]HDR2620849.1 SymE family type I addiction module toxin [Enterobacter chuandaensis]